MIRVQAKLKLDNDEGDMVQLDVPEEYCNRKDILNILRTLFLICITLNTRLLNDRD